MDIAGLLLLLLIGCIAGFLAGFFDVEVGIILVPLLLYYFLSLGISSLVATHLTFGTCLLTVIFASLLGAYEHSQKRHVLWRAVLLISAGSVIGVLIGTDIAAGLQGRSLQRIFAIVAVYAAIRLLAEPKRPKENPQLKSSPAVLGLIGLIAGLVSPLAGVGCGVFSIPMMNYFAKFPLKKALGTSSAAAVIIAIVSTTGYIVKGWENPLLPPHTWGFVDYFSAAPIVVGTLPFIQLGASAAQRDKFQILRKGCAVFLLAAAMKMAFF
jgi:uncharacterized membrane protein YfcA